MDAQRPTRERVFSILNDNDSPSFVIRQKQCASAVPSHQKLPPISAFGAFSPRSERPSLSRLPHFNRNDSISSVGSPPLLRHDSSASSKSSSSMDSTPSPATPAYNYNEPAIGSYDNLLRQDPSMSFLPSPTGITPFIEQSMLLGPVPQEAYLPKSVQPLAPAAYPPIPLNTDLSQISTPALSTELSNVSNASANSQARAVPASLSNQSSNNNGTGKKNKYPCPYAQSHNCSATFTTSGHAARHGKKHTGEKGVHCPVCDKAFTRKDNMKQHERTHKNKAANGEEKKSKAQATRDANKAKEVQQQDMTEQLGQQSVQANPSTLRRISSGNSEPSDTTLFSNPILTPTEISPTFFTDNNPQILLPDGTLPVDPTNVSMYPPLVDESLIPVGLLQPAPKLEVPIAQPPILIRGFSDLDTLAQAAENAFDPYYQQAQPY